MTIFKLKYITEIKIPTGCKGRKKGDRGKY